MSQNQTENIGVMTDEEVDQLWCDKRRDMIDEKLKELRPTKKVVSTLMGLVALCAAGVVYLSSDRSKDGEIRLSVPDVATVALLAGSAYALRKAEKATDLSEQSHLIYDHLKDGYLTPERQNTICSVGTEHDVKLLIGTAVSIGGMFAVPFFPLEGAMVTFAGSALAGSTYGKVCENRARMDHALICLAHRPIEHDR